MIATAPVLHRLGQQDAMDAQRLQARIALATPPGHLRDRTRDEFADIFSGKRGAAFGMRDDAGELIAMGLLVTMDGRPDGPSFPRIPAEDWAQHCAFMESTMVLPHARGRGYQRLLLHMRMAEAKARGVRWFCAGVHRSNAPSLRNLIATGFAVVGMRGDCVFGLLRRADGAPLAMDAEDLKCAPLAAAEPHQRALRGNYIGVRTHGDALVYARSSTPIDSEAVFD